MYSFETWYVWLLQYILIWTQDGTFHAFLHVIMTFIITVWLFFKFWSIQMFWAFVSVFSTWFDSHRHIIFDGLAPFFFFFFPLFVSPLWMGAWADQNFFSLWDFSMLAWWMMLWFLPLILCFVLQLVVKVWEVVSAFFFFF